MPTTKFEYIGESVTLGATYLHSCQLLFLEFEEYIALTVQNQGLLFVLNGLGEMRTTHEQIQRRSTLAKQQLFALQPGTEISLRGGQASSSTSLLYIDFSIFSCFRTDVSHFSYKKENPVLPFCMHVSPLDMMDILLQQIVEELTTRNFGHITVIQSILIKLVDLWQSSAQQVFSSFWSAIDSVWISGNFSETGQTLAFSDMSMMQESPDASANSSIPLGFFPASQCQPLLYCRERVTSLPATDARFRSFHIRGAFTLVIPILESQKPLDLSQLRGNSFLEADFISSAPCTLDISVYSQAIQEGTLYRLHCETPDMPLRAKITTSGDRSRFSLSWHVQNAQAYILQHYRERLRLEQIAGELHINANYLSTIFHQQMGMTISAYIHTLRLEEAARLLIHTEETMKTIAQELGFCDIQHFSKAFQKKYNMRPLAYRQTYHIRAVEENFEKSSEANEHKSAP